MFRFIYMKPGSSDVKGSVEGWRRKQLKEHPYYSTPVGSYGIPPNTCYTADDTFLMSHHYRCSPKGPNVANVRAVTLSE
uniref:Uncharacterized protein n=1 Tax=Anguilla anguilla TaxID=7936 RepID=A0A0E9QX45_ANGAN